MLEKQFWYQTECFGVRGIIGDNFQEPQINLKAKQEQGGGSVEGPERPHGVKL